MKMLQLVRTLIQALASDIGVSETLLSYQAINYSASSRVLGPSYTTLVLVLVFGRLVSSRKGVSRISSPIPLPFRKPSH